MACGNCGFANPEGTKFCEEYGSKLVRACPSCGREVRPTAKFCGECGAALTGKVPGSTFQVPRRQPLPPNPQSLIPKHRRKHVAIKHWKSLASNKRDSSNCALRRVLPACGGSRASATRRTPCCPKSTTGSPKDSIRKICKRRRRCWKNSSIESLSD